MRRRMGRAALASGVALVLAGVGLGLGTGVADANSTGSQKLGVPAYWAPYGAGVAAFDQLADATATVEIVVVNGPTGSPPKPFDPATGAQVRKLTRAGATVLGYVDTGYLGRTGMVTTRVNPGSTRPEDWRAQAELDIADWARLYGL